MLISLHYYKQGFYYERSKVLGKQRISLRRLKKSRSLHVHYGQSVKRNIERASRKSAYTGELIVNIAITCAYEV